MTLFEAKEKGKKETIWNTGVAFVFFSYFMTGRRHWTLH